MFFLEQLVCGLRLPEIQRGITQRDFLVANELGPEIAFAGAEKLSSFAIRSIYPLKFALLSAADAKLPDDDQPALPVSQRLLHGWYAPLGYLSSASVRRM